MPTIFVSGNDTDIGKTWVVATILRSLPAQERSIQLIKPVQTGVEYGCNSDVEEALKLSGRNHQAFTLAEYPLPLNPLDAAIADGKKLSYDLIMKKWHQLPPASWRIVEGAGGLAVPLDENGCDWADFAKAIKADFVILVIGSRLGSINQGRLTATYAKMHDLPAYLWLNEVEPINSRVYQSNLYNLKKLDTPLLANQSAGRKTPEWFLPAPWLEQS